MQDNAPHKDDMAILLLSDIEHDAGLIKKELRRVEIAHGAHILPRDTSSMLAWLVAIEKRVVDLRRLMAAAKEAEGHDQG